MAFPRLRLNVHGDEKPLHPNHLVYKKIEAIVRRMLCENEGVPLRTVKSFLSKIPSVLNGYDIVQWLLKNIPTEDLNEALHLAHMISSHGYLFPIDDHLLTVKNDNTFYRFQTPYFWPSNCWEPENTDYAVYLCKRTMQNKAHLQLQDFEAENLARLQKMFSRKWEFIFMQAEAQYKVDKKRDRQERQILDSQERAFWDVHRPVPGSVNTAEVDFRKLSRSSRPKHDTSTPLISRPGSRRYTNPAEAFKSEVVLLESRLARNTLKTSKVAEFILLYAEQRKEFDPFFTPTEPANPWLADQVDFWVIDATGEVTPRRVRRWALSFDELLTDSAGREFFMKFLVKEFSGENLRFWIAVQNLRSSSSRYVPIRVTEIYCEFLGPNSTCPVNVDSKVIEITNQNLENSGRWSFDEAAEHIHCLMKNDSYQRFVRSDFYRELLIGAKKKVNTPGKVSALRSVISFPGNKQNMISAF